MTRLRVLWTAAAAVTLSLLSACAQPIVDGEAGGGGASASPSGPSGDPDALVLRVRQTGGFVGPDALAGELPDLSVYADGRMIFGGPTVMSYPGPALPNVQVLMISPDALATLVDKAVAAGVKPGTDFGQPGVADARTTQVTLVTASGAQTAEANALGEAQPNDPMLTPAQQDARAKLRAYLDELDKLKSGAAVEQYKPEMLAAVARPYANTDDTLPGKPKEQKWAGPALPGEPLNAEAEISCVTATGEQADAIVAAAEKANANTPWLSEGKSWTVRFRPLLPDETGCADLKAER